MKYSLLLVRISKYSLGLLFIISGLIKANDPLSLSYKMNEFYEMFHLSWLEPISLWMAIILILIETVLGVMLLTGLWLNITIRSICLLNIFFLFLTGYATFSGKIATCGCMGNCIPLSSQQSFIKDIILTLLSFYLLRKRTFLQTTIIPQLYRYIISIGIFVLSLSIAISVLYYLPIIDCLPFKKNLNLRIEKYRLTPDHYIETSFTYKKNGQLVTFNTLNFPKDLDSTYEFIKREDKTIVNNQSANNALSIKSFKLFDDKDQDITDQILYHKEAYLFFVPHWQKINPKSVGQLFQDFIQAKKSLYLINSNDNEDNTAIALFLKARQWDTIIPLLHCDISLMKTIARSHLSLYLLHYGTIMKKQGEGQLL